MTKKENIIKALNLLSVSIPSELRWIVVSSGALFVHGLDIVPNDLDLAVHKNDLDKVIKSLDEKFDKQDSTYILSGIEVEVFGSELKVDKIKHCKIGDHYLPVNPLKIELTYCMERKDKDMTGRIAMINRELRRRDNDPN